MSRFSVDVAIPFVLLMGAASQAGVVIEWVSVGDAGNEPDIRYETPGYGGVDYEYRIGKYEVTNGQYIEFLSAVAGLGDPNGLYSVEMGGDYGGIVRTGSGTEGDPWIYGPKGGDTNWLNKPLNYVNWYDALRFANWLGNGQPTGAQDVSTTEAGAYTLSGPTSVDECVPGEHLHCPDAEVWLPTEDEWYKAAHYKSGGTDVGYWDYATQGNTVPTSEPPPGTDLVNRSANYGGLGLPYYTTDVGAYTAKPSDSAYNTFGQNGNLWEWNEADIFGDGTSRGLRGGSWCCPGFFLSASVRNSDMATIEAHNVGFRLASSAVSTLFDFAEFQNCFSGVGGAVLPGCDIFDYEPDDDVDLDDYSEFLLTFNGS